MSTLLIARKKLGITQQEAADRLKISRRTYQSFENDLSKQNTYKYEHFLSVLSKKEQIDEEHGTLKIKEIFKICQKVLNNYSVRSCYLFGSYAKGKENQKSDVDLLIDTDVTGIKFFGLVEELRVSLGKKVDLLDLNQVINNKQLLSEILKDGIKIYG